MPIIPTQNNPSGEDIPANPGDIVTLQGGQLLQVTDHYTDGAGNTNGIAGNILDANGNIIGAANVGTVNPPSSAPAPAPAALSAAPAAVAPVPTDKISFCEEETRVSTHTCNSLYPAITFNPHGDAFFVWQDNRFGNFEIMGKMIPHGISREDAALGNDAEQQNGRTVDLDCNKGFSTSGFSSYSLSDQCAAADAADEVSQGTVIDKRKGGVIDVSVSTSTTTFTLANGSPTFDALGIRIDDRVRVLDGLNEGKEFSITRVLSPRVAELTYLGSESSDTNFTYQIVSGETSSVDTCETRLTCTKGMSIFPDVVSDAEGRFHVVYQDNEPGKFQLYYVQIYDPKVGLKDCSTTDKPPVANSGGGFGELGGAGPGAIEFTFTDENGDTQTAHFQATGEDGQFFSYGNRLLPTPVPNQEGDPLGHTGLHKIFKDLSSDGDGSLTGVSLADDRDTWDLQNAETVGPEPTFVAEEGHPLLDAGDFGMRLDAADIAFMMQAPPDKNVAVSLLALPLGSKCAPTALSGQITPRFQDLKSAPKYPVPPTFVDPLDVSSLLGSAATRVDQDVPQRFTIEGDRSGTVFTNILCDDGRGAISRVIFRKSEDRNGPKFILGHIACGEEFCAVSVPDSDQVSVPPSLQRKVKLEIWRGSDYRKDETQVESASMGVSLFFQKEFTFDPGEDIGTFAFEKGELSFPAGAVIFAIVKPEVPEFIIEGVGGGHAIWQNSGSVDKDAATGGQTGEFSQYYVPYTLQPNKGLSVPVYYEGILEPATCEGVGNVENTVCEGEDSTTGTSGGDGGGNVDGGPKDFTIDTVTGNYNQILNGAFAFGMFESGVPGLTWTDAGVQVVLANPCTIKKLRIGIAVSPFNNGLGSPLVPFARGEENLNIRITPVIPQSQAINVRPDDNRHVEFIPDLGNIYFSKTIDALDISQLSSRSDPFDPNAHIIEVDVNIDVPAGTFAVLFSPRAVTPPANSIDKYTRASYYMSNSGDRPEPDAMIAKYALSGFQTGNVYTTGDPILQEGFVHDGVPAMYIDLFGIDNGVVQTPPPDPNTDTGGDAAVSDTDPCVAIKFRDGEFASVSMVTVGTAGHFGPLPIIVKDVDAENEQLIIQGPISSSALHAAEFRIDGIEAAPLAISAVEVDCPDLGSGGGGTSTGGGTTELKATLPLRLTQNEGNDQHPRMAINQNDDIWLVWYSDRTGVNEVFMTKYFGRCGIWDVPTLGGSDHQITFFGEQAPDISGKRRHAEFPNVAVDKEGEAHIVFQATDEDGRRQIYYMRTTGGGASLSGPFKVTNSPKEALMPDIKVAYAEGKERVVITWHDSRYGDYEIMSTTKVNGIWSGSGQAGQDTRITAATGDSMFPRLAADKRGNLRVVYQDYRLGKEAAQIFVSTYVVSASRWDSSAQGGKDMMLSHSPAQALHPDIDVDKTGGIGLGWHDTRHEQENPDQHEEVYGLFCSGGTSHPFPHFPPLTLTTNIEAYLDVQFNIVDCVGFNPIDFTNAPEVCLQITSPGATFFRVANEDGNWCGWKPVCKEDGWQPFKANDDLETMLVPWSLTCGNGKKKVCVQIQNQNMVSFPICREVILAMPAPAFTVEMFLDADMSFRLPTFNGMPVAKAGDVYVKITASEPMIRPPSFDVLHQGLYQTFNQKTMAISGYSGTAGIGSFIGNDVRDDLEHSGFSASSNTVFKSKFRVRCEDGTFYVDGLARIVPHGNDVCGNVF